MPIMLPGPRPPLPAALSRIQQARSSSSHDRFLAVPEGGSATAPVWPLAPSRVLAQGRRVLSGFDVSAGPSL